MEVITRLADLSSTKSQKSLECCFLWGYSDVTRVNAEMTPESAVTQETVVGYIRCGVPDDWGYRFPWHRSPSRSTKNELFNLQWNQLRAFARDHHWKLTCRFFDPEGSLYDFNQELPLIKRQQLAELFVWSRAQSHPVIVLVDDRKRLEPNEVLRARLLKAFDAAFIQVIETSTGRNLGRDHAEVLEKAKPRTLAKANRLVALWLALVARFEKDMNVGRKPYGGSANPEEEFGLQRLKELYRSLPRNQWRRRGDRVFKRRSFRQIASMLNEEGIPTRTGKPWTDGTVRGILKRLKLLKEGE